MAQPPQQQQRPTFPGQTQTYTTGYTPNGRPQFSPGPQSPQHALSYSSPSPQSQFSPGYSGQAPPAKRPRLSSEAPSPIPQSTGTPVPQVTSPIGHQINGINTPSQSRPPNTMLPPSTQPQIKREPEDGSLFRDENALNHSSVNPVPNSLPPSAPRTPQPVTPGIRAGPDMIPRPNINSEVTSIALATNVPVERQEQRQDWSASQQSQHELWDPFLFLGNVNDHIKTISQRTNLVEPQSGVLVNTQKSQPAPTVRVNGYEGASRVIKDGQSIIDTRTKADRLRELVNVLSLAAKSRLTGLLSSAGRNAEERRKHSQGRVPGEWADVAAIRDSAQGELGASPAPAAGMKRTYSQANSETASRKSLQVAPQPSVVELETYSKREVKAESARQAKRRKRSEAISAKEKAETAAQEEAEVTAVAEQKEKGNKKTAKAEARDASDANQVNATNNALASALAGRSNNPGQMFRMGGKKAKTYAWMNSGSTPASGTATPVRAPPPSRPNKEKGADAPKGPKLGEYDEEADPGVQLRDLLSVLEFDGRAPKSFVRGSSSNPFEDTSNG